MQLFDDIYLRSKIVHLLEENNKISSEDCTSDIILSRAIKLLSEIEIYYKELSEVLLNYEIVVGPKPINDMIYQTQLTFNKSYNISMSSDEKFSDITIPLYIIYVLIKLAENNTILPKYISVTNFSNLKKEEQYMKSRECNQMILFWRDMDDGHYIVLSIIMLDVNELDFEQNIFFLSHVGGTTIEECEELWNKYNKTTIDYLIINKNLMSLKNALKKLTTIKTYDNI